MPGQGEASRANMLSSSPARMAAAGDARAAAGRIGRDQRLAASGYAVIQTTSPLIARKSFWTVVETIESVGLTAKPYHAHVPSFGEWGFVLASRRPWRLPEALPEGLRFLSLPTLPLLFDFPLDMARVPAEVQRLSNQVLVTTYEREWGKH